MKDYNFDKYPTLQAHVRHLMAFDGLAGPNAKIEFVDALAAILERLEKCEEYIAAHSPYLTNPASVDWLMS